MKRIKVRLVNGSEQFFPYYVLDHFIKKRAITAFERSNGWVEIEKDPVRKRANPNYDGNRKRFSDFLIKKRVTDRLLR